MWLGQSDGYKSQSLILKISYYLLEFFKANSYVVNVAINSTR